MGTHIIPSSFVASTRCSRQWLQSAIDVIQAEINRSADTHLIRYDLPSPCGLTVIILINLLMLNGQPIGEETTILQIQFFVR